MADDKTQPLINSPEEDQINELEEQSSVQSKNVVKNVLQNKKLVLFFVVGIVVLLSIIILSLTTLFSTSESTDTPTDTIPTPASNAVPSGTDTVPTEQPTPTPNESKEAVEIKTQLKPQIEESVAGPYEISRVKIYQSTWSLIQLHIPSAGYANVVLKKEGGSWKVILGPGSSFDPEDLDAVGVPQEIKNDINGVAF